MPFAKIVAFVRGQRELTAQRERYYRPPPCMYCAFAGETNTGQNHGYVCLWFDIYIPREDAKDGDSNIRQTCLKTGNHFRFRIKGVTPDAMLAWKERHSGLWLSRRSTQLAMIVGVISLILTAVGIWLK